MKDLKALSLLGLSESSKGYCIVTVGARCVVIVFFLSCDDKTCLSQHFVWVAHAVTFPSGIECYLKKLSSGFCSGVAVCRGKAGGGQDLERGPSKLT